MLGHSLSPQTRVAIAACFVVLAACAGNQHISTGTFQFTLRGAFNAQVSGVATGQYPDQFSSSGRDYSIWLPFCPPTAMLERSRGRREGEDSLAHWGLAFLIDSLPSPGRYEMVSTIDGRRSARTIAAILSSSTGADRWVPVSGGLTEFLSTTEPDGLRARFAFRMVRPNGTSDTTEVTGAFETGTKTVDVNSTYLSRWSCRNSR